MAKLVLQLHYKVSACKVIGYVEKGDMMIAGNDGFAISSKSPALGTVIGKALEDYKGEGEGVIEVVVGRL